MDREEQPEEQPEVMIEAPQDELWEDEDWIGEIAGKVKAFRDEMADVGREADEGMIDGPLGKVVAFLKRYWAVLLIALLPLTPKLVERWAENNPFPAIPEIISEAELKEISDYIVRWDAASARNMNWMHSCDRDGDGVRDVTIHAFAAPEEDRKELYIRTSLELPTLGQLITGECGFEAQGEEMALQDGRICLIITAAGPTRGDRSELRLAVEETLEVIRQAREDEAAGLIPTAEVEAIPAELLDILPDELWEQLFDTQVKDEER